MKMYVSFKTIEGELCLHKGVIPPSGKRIKLLPVSIGTLGLMPSFAIKHDGYNFYMTINTAIQNIK